MPTYLTMTICTKTNSYLSIITEKLWKWLQWKSLGFVEVAILSHREEEADGFFLRFHKGAAIIYVNREGCEWQMEWVVLLGRIFSDRIEILAL